MRNLSRWFKQTVIVVAVLGLLTSAWPSVAQGNTPPAQPELKDFLEKRLHEISDVEPNHLRQDDSNQPAASSDSMWTIATLARQAAHPSIAVDVASHLHLSFASATGLTYAYFDGTTWQYTTVESAPFDSVIATAIALTPAGQPRIAYSLNGLKYAYLDQTGWHTELIDTAADTVDLAIDAGGTPHVGYNNSEIRLADRDNAGWHIMTLDSSGQSVSLRTGNSLYIGNLHMTYILPGGVEYAWNYAPRGEWHKYLYVSDPNARYSSMAAFYNGEAMQLAYCSCAGNASLHMDYWDYNDIHRNEVVDGGTPNWTGGDLSLAAYADRQYIAYFATDTGPHLKYAYKINNIWTLELIDDQVNLSPSTVITPEVALAFNTAGRAYTVYNDGDGVLKYAVRRPAMATWVDLTFGSYRDNNWEVYTARADGRNQARRTIDPTYDSTPKFNRGASQIAFVSARNGNYEIYTMNADGSGQTRRTTTSANEYQPVWSPDGSKIAFYSYRDGNAEIYVMNANGSNQTRLTSNSAWDGHPAWAPDGAQLVFSSNRSGTDDLWIMNTNGTNQHQLTFGLNAAYPDWSPDGSKIIFNDDTNHDGWLDIAIVDVTGGNLLHPLGYSPVNYDYAAPTWSPIGQDYAFAKIQWVYYQGNYYWIDAYLYAVVEGITNQLTTSGVDWWPNWQPTDVWPPSSHIKTLPAFLGTSQFTVEWSGIDTGASDVMSYDIQYRDGANGVWTDWLTATNQTSAAFTGQYGHTYYFRSRARDYANNLEAYPSGNGDTSTIVYQYSLTGKVHGNRNQPVTVASITANPTALNTGISRHDGLFDLYFASGDIYTLTATRSAFGLLPPLFNVSVPLSMSLPPLYLPPLDDLISDSHFESGNLSAWNPIGLLTPTVTSTAHTGDYAILLGGIVPSDTVDIAPYLSAIEQTITVPLTLTDGTLSLLYEVIAVDSLSDTFTAYLIGPTETLTFTLPVTVTDWTHQWFDVSTWMAPSATLRLELSTPDKDRAIGVLIDEVTWGSSIVGSRPIYLPVMHR